MTVIDRVVMGEPKIDFFQLPKTGHLPTFINELVQYASEIGWLYGDYAVIVPFTQVDVLELMDQCIEKGLFDGTIPPHEPVSDKPVREELMDWIKSLPWAGWDERIETVEEVAEAAQTNGKGGEADIYVGW